MAFKKKKKVLGEWRCYKNKIDLLFDLYSYYLINNIYIVLRIILFQSCFCDATSPNTFFFLKAMIMITQGQESKHQLYPALPICSIGLELIQKVYTSVHSNPKF